MCTYAYIHVYILATFLQSLTRLCGIFLFRPFNHLRYLLFFLCKIFRAKDLKRKQISTLLSSEMSFADTAP